MAKATPPTTALDVGQCVFFREHGAAKVVGKETRQFGDVQQLFFVFELAHKVRLLLPEGKLQQAGQRDLVSPEKAKALIAQVREVPRDQTFKVDHASRKKRALAHAETIRSGSADDYTKIFMELLAISYAGKISASEKRTLTTVRGFFVGEMSASLGVSIAEIEESCGLLVS